MKLYTLSFIVIVFVFTSCITILQSLITADNIKTDDRMEGVWVDQDSKTILVQKLWDSKFKHMFNEARMGDKPMSWKDSVFYTKHYIISYREKDINYAWIAGMVKIKGQYYLNLQPEEISDDQGVDVDNMGEPSCSIAKLEWKNNNVVTLTFLNGNRIKEIILGGKAQIKHEYDPLFETFVITASSGELTLFLERYGHKKDLYIDGNIIIFKRKN